MRVTLLGTGSPLPDPHRAGPATLVEAGGLHLLFDCGRGVLMRLAAAGLPPDYQTMPVLNFRNIASEATGDQSLKLLENTYVRVTERAKGFLTAEELAKFSEFGKKAIENNRSALLMNRKLMAPIAK